MAETILSICGVIAKTIIELQKTYSQLPEAFEELGEMVVRIEDLVDTRTKAGLNTNFSKTMKFHLEQSQAFLEDVRNRAEELEKEGSCCRIFKKSSKKVSDFMGSLFGKGAAEKIEQIAKLIKKLKEDLAVAVAEQGAVAVGHLAAVSEVQKQLHHIEEQKTNVLVHFTSPETAAFWQKYLGSNVLSATFETMLNILKKALKDQQQEEHMSILFSLPKLLLEPALAGSDKMVDPYEFDIIVGEEGFPKGFTSWLSNLNKAAEPLIKDGALTEEAVQMLVNNLVHASTVFLQIQADISRSQPTTASSVDIELLLRLAAAHEKGWEFPKAVEVYRELLPAARQQCPPEKLSFVLRKFAGSLETISEFTEAIEIYREAQGLTPASDKPSISACLDGIGWCLMCLGDHQEALGSYQASLKINEEIADQSGIASSLNGIGNCLDCLGEYKEAVKHHRKSLKIREKIGDNSAIAASFNNLGIVLGSLGQYQEAMEHHRKSLKIQEEIGYKSGIAASLSNIGDCLESLGEFLEAMEHHRKSLKIEQEIGNKSGIATSLNDIGNCLENLGEHEEAMEHHRKSLNIGQEIGDKSVITNSLTGMGNCLCSLGEHKESMEHHKESLKISEEIGDKPGTATSLDGIGFCLEKLGEFQEAIPLFQKSLNINQQLGLQQKMAVCLKNIGDCQKELGQNEKAIAHYKQSLEFCEQAGGYQQTVEYLKKQIEELQG